MITTDYGPALIEHVLLGVDLRGTEKIGQGFDLQNNLSKIINALKEAQDIVENASLSVSKANK